MKLTVTPETVSVETGDNERDIFTESTKDRSKELLDFIYAVRENALNLKISENKLAGQATDAPVQDKEG